MPSKQWSITADGKILLGAPPCGSCRGVCCSVDAGWKFVELTPEEQRHPLFKDKVRTHIAGIKGFYYTPKGGGAGGGYCPFFKIAERKCGIYEDRPVNCRNFDCRACRADGHFMKANPDVAALVGEAAVAKPTVSAAAVQAYVAGEENEEISKIMGELSIEAAEQGVDRDHSETERELWLERRMFEILGIK